MRTIPRWLTVFAILLAGWAGPLSQAQAGNPAAPAQQVSGQPAVLPPTPALTALSPSTVAAGSADFTLTVNGSGFVGSSLVRWNGGDRPTTYLSSTSQLNAAISAADVVGGGPFSVTVFTPSGGTSSPITLTLYTRVGHDATADTVQGQPNFTVNNTNNALMTAANQLDQPYGLAVDAHTGRLFVADTNNNRVLSWPNAAARANGQAADLVIGQPNFISHTANTNGISGNSLNFPTGVALDAQGRLYVADGGNNRVLEYTAPLTNGMAANGVFGQGGSFTTTAYLSVTAASLRGPFGVALDAQGQLYVTDNGNSRVLEYDTPLTSTTANRVFGQSGSFTTNTANEGGLGPASLKEPTGVALDAQGHLCVADWQNNRVLEYTAPLTSTTADHVFGQPNFTSNNYNITGIVTPTAASLYFPLGVALDVQGGQGNLYVADSFNIRVLEYDTPLTTDTTADRVFGQGGSFTTPPANTGVNAASLFGPAGVALDAPGNLYVADQLNNRVLEYDAHAPLLLFLPLVRR
jgi:sugar lactone lactonase YvrE